MKNLSRFLLLIIFILQTGNAYAQDYWEKTAGPGGSTVNCLVVNSVGDLFAGTKNSGIFRSSDRGDTWTAINAGLPNLKVLSIAIKSNGLIFIGTGDDGVYGSSNNGDSWSPVNAGVANSPIFSIAINAAGNMFAGSLFGLYIYSDNNNVWLKTNLPSKTVYRIAINTAGEIFVATSSDGVYLSKNNGTNWTQINNGLTSKNTRSLTINESGDLFVGTFNGVYRSTDNGANWAQTGLENISVFSLGINSFGTVFAGTVGSGIYRSGDNGDNWRTVNTGLTNTDVRSLSFNSNNSIFAGTNGNGVFRSLQPTTSLEDKRNIKPTGYSLSQNFPNPFNPSTTIKYQIAEPNFVSLKVYDVLGKEIAALINEEQTTGNYEIEFDASHLVSGIYLYQIQAGSFIQSKKLMLLK